MGCEDFSVGEFDDSPAVVAVAVFGELAVDGLLAEGDYAVDLLFGVGEARGYVQVVPADVDLQRRVRGKGFLKRKGEERTSCTPMSTKTPPDWAEKVTKKPTEWSVDRVV